MTTTTERVDGAAQHLVAARHAGSPGPLLPDALRPDDIERAEAGADNAFDATVETVEYGGRDSLIRAITPFGSIWARVAGEFTQGERLRLRVAPARTLVYAGEAQ